MQRQNSTKKNIYETGSIKSGFLRKQGGIVKSWHQRWFILKGDSLYYFAKETDTKTLGTIFLPGNQVNELPLNLDDPGKFFFEILPGGDKSRISPTHETYLLCADSDEDRKEWIQAIEKTIYAKIGGAIFGQSLTETMSYQGRNIQIQVPLIVDLCVDYIRRHGMETEGIFRLAGRTVLIKELKNSFQRAEISELNGIEGLDVHTVASLLKRYLTHLPQPIIPYVIYEPVIKLITRDMQESEEMALTSLSELLITLPKHNYNLLKYICSFLHEVFQLQDFNKMSDANLATVFANCVIRPDCEDPALLMGTTGGRTLVTRVLISNYPKIFKIEYNTQGDKVEVDTLLSLGQDTGESTVCAEETAQEPMSPSVGLLDMAFSDVTVLPEPLFATSASKTKKANAAISDSAAVISTVDKSMRSGSVSSGELENGEVEDIDAELDALINTDLFQLSLEDIHHLMDQVKTEVINVRQKYREHIAAIKVKADQQKAKHKQKLEQMAQMLEKEKQATCNVVSKVVSLQGQLQTYQMKYGMLE